VRIDVAVFVAHLLLLLLLILCSVANEVDLMMSFAHPHVVCAYHFVTWKRRNAKEATGGTDLDATVSASAPSCMLCNSLLVCRWFYCHDSGGHMGPCASCIPLQSRRVCFALMRQCMPLLASRSAAYDSKHCLLLSPPPPLTPSVSLASCVCSLTTACNLWM
jgi:hypothetical protein